MGMERISAKLHLHALPLRYHVAVFLRQKYHSRCFLKINQIAVSMPELPKNAFHAQSGGPWVLLTIMYNTLSTDLHPFDIYLLPTYRVWRVGSMCPVLCLRLAPCSFLCITFW